uniref:Uncharacterized protein n=1 Tax=Romanomermis culicivorax TaxID=13658 RepID=A0A915JQR1_ROMCU
MVPAFWYCSNIITEASSRLTNVLKFVKALMFNISSKTTSISSGVLSLGLQKKREDPNNSHILTAAAKRPNDCLKSIYRRTATDQWSRRIIRNRASVPTCNKKPKATTKSWSLDVVELDDEASFRQFPDQPKTLKLANFTETNDFAPVDSNKRLQLRNRRLLNAAARMTPEAELNIHRRSM